MLETETPRLERDAVRRIVTGIAARPLILVTGWRQLTGQAWVENQFEEVSLELCRRTPATPPILVHGAHRGGADKYAEMWGSRQPRNQISWIERFPANWTKLGDAAGPIRNAAMVERAWAQQMAGGAVVVMAFPERPEWTKGSGTWNAIDLAEKWGLEDIRILTRPHE